MLQVDTLSTKDPVGSSAPVAPMRALVLDDNRFDQRKIDRVARQTGLQINMTFVSTADMLAARITETAFDVILLDYLLPDCSGYDALNMVRDCPLNNSVPVIMVAGDSALDDDAIRMFEASDAHIAKQDLSAETLRQALVSTVKSPIDADLPDALPSGSLDHTQTESEIEDLLRHLRMTVAERRISSAEDIAFFDSLETRLIRLWHTARAESHGVDDPVRLYTIQ